MKRRITQRPLVGLLILALAAAAGCGKKPESSTPTQGMATQGSSAEAKATYDDPVLAQLTRDLRRWIVVNKVRPASFEDYVTRAKVTPPPPPAGKKYALSGELRVIYASQ